MNRRKTSPTISQIAEKADTSIATVSRALGSSGYPVAKDTYNRIIEAAKSLGYNFPKDEKPSTSNDVVIMLPSLTNQFYSILLSGLESTLRSLNYDSMIINTCESVDFEKSILRKIADRPDLKLIIAPVSEHIEHIAALSEKHIPMIIMERNKTLLEPTISVDYFAAGKIITDYMIEKGLKRIAFLGAPLTRYSRINLFDGYKYVLDNHHSYDESLVFLSDPKQLKTDGLPKETDNTIANSFTSFYNNSDMSPYYNGIYLATKLMEAKKRPDAIVCNNDMTAIGAMTQLQQLGINIPGDISIAGSDNIFSSAISFPPLTTVDQCTYEIGGMAANLLHSRLTDKTFKPIEVILKPKLVIRDSVKK